MSSRPVRTLVATAPDGTEVTQKTSGSYDTAGLIQARDGHWFIAAHGWSHESVYNRTHVRYNRGDYQAMHVSGLVEQTAPVIRDYCGTHDTYVIACFTPGKGWVRERQLAGRSHLRRLARNGVTDVAVNHNGNEADFPMSELLKSMNAKAGAR